MKAPLFLISCALLLVSCGKKEVNSESSSTLYHNGDILTMRSDVPEYEEALVVQEGKIVFVGNKDKAMKSYPNSEIKDLKGRTLMPGFIDGHAHFANFSIQSIGAQILPPPDAGAKDIPTLIQILKDWNTPENRSLTGWIFGIGFDDSVLEEKRFPTKHDLDQVSEEFPVLIIHISGHFAVVNSKGLEELGIDASTKDPEGGIIRRENENDPNGVLEELAAIPYMLKVLNPSSKQAADIFFEGGQNMALSYGYTTAQEGRAMQNHEMLAEAARNNQLKLDVVSYIDYLFVDKYMDSPWNSKSYTNHYRIGGMKLTLDGSPQGRTAWRTQPYLIPPDGAEKGYLGYPAIPQDSVVSSIYEKGFQNNWQILTHGNGDAAIDQMIRTLGPLTRKYGNEDRRNVLIHGQYVREDQLDSLKQLDMIASLFPLHTFYWGDWHKEIIGDSLGNKISPTRTALNKGLKLTTHTDAPVALPNLMRMVGISVERKSRSGALIGPEEGLTPYEALQSITSWSAYQHFEEDSKGTLEVGKLADLVVLDNNPLKVDPSEIKNILVLETIKEGKTVFEKRPVEAFNRRIQLKGEHNFRDLGNYETTDQKKLNTGMLYRSGSLYKLTPEDTARLKELGIKTVVNFLNPNEIENRGGDILPEGVQSIYLPIEGMGDEVDDLIVARKTGDFSKIPADFNYSIHAILPESGKKSYAELFEVLSDSNNYPIVFHCSHGVHRTGTAAALVLSSVGVPWETISEDYMLSNEYRLPESQKRIEVLDSIARSNDEIADKERNRKHIEAFYLLEPAYIEGTKTHILEEYGSFEAYLESANVSQAEIDKVRDNLLNE